MLSRCGAIVFLFILVRPASDACGEVLFADVQRAVERGVAFLHQQQNATTEQWPGDELHADGRHALATLALLKSGNNIDDPAVQTALHHLRIRTDSKSTYDIALQTLALCAAEPKYDAILIQQCVDRLESALAKGKGLDGWNDSTSTQNGRNPNGRFAILALHEAQQAGAWVSAAAWQRAAAFYLKGQNQDGSWSDPATASGIYSMTCAALTGLSIARGSLPANDPSLQGCDAAMARGRQWMERHFSVEANRRKSDNALCSYDHLHALAQYGRTSGRYIVGEHSWWKEGAQVILHDQQADGSWKGTSEGDGQPIMATSLALLFLAESPMRASESHSRQSEPDTPAAYTSDQVESSGGKLRVVIPIKQFDGYYLRFSHDGGMLASCGLTQWMRLWDSNTGKLAREIPMRTLLAGEPAFSPDGKSVALADANMFDKIVLWDLRGTERPRTFDLPNAKVKSPLFSPDGRLLLALAEPQGCVLWNLASGTQKAAFRPAGAIISSIIFSSAAIISPNGKTVAMSNLELRSENVKARVVRLWDIDTQHERAVLGTEHELLSTMAFSPDGKTLATASDNHSVLLWDAVTGRLKAACYGHLNNAVHLAFSRDGRLLASAGDDRFIELWDVATGRERAVLFGHAKKVESIAFSPDGRYLVSASADKTVRFWDVASHRCAAVLRLDAEPYTIALSPDGKSLASSSGDRRIRLWNLGKVLEAGENLDAVPGRTEEKHARGMIEGLGGTVEINWHEYVTQVSFHSGLFEVPEQFRFVDGDLKLLKQFPQLATLVLTRTKVTDAGLAALVGLRELTVLDLSKNDIGDAGLKWVAKLPKLEQLYLADTKVTDAGLEQIAVMKNLKTVYLSGTQVTAKGILALKQRCPRLQVEH